MIMKKLKLFFLVMILFLSLMLSSQNLQSTVQRDTLTATDLSLATGNWEFQTSPDGKSLAAICTYKIPSYITATSKMLYFRSI